MLKNYKINIDDTYVDYIKFGKGKKNLIIIPGLGESLKNTKGMGILLAYMYRCFSKNYTVYIFSRRNKLEEGFTTEDMANDIIILMNKLNINKASIAGVSQGGMISQYVAINHPERVDKLVLIVTLSRKNEIISSIVTKWIEFAMKNDYKSLFIDTMENSYTEKTLKKIRKIYTPIIKITTPKNFDRFLIEANACITHNSYNKLNKIKCPTLIIGGKQDKIVGEIGSKEIHQKIKQSELYIYDNYGHGLYEEVDDFNKRVLDFLNK